MDFSLTETQLSLQRLAHEFAEKEIRPAARERERIRDPKERFPWEILEKGSRLGLRTLSLPEERGGAGATILDLCVVGEELAWGDLGVAVTFDQTWKISHFLDRMWNEEQRGRFLQAFLEDHRFHLAVGMTEPDAGSENFIPADRADHGVRLRAVRDGDWVLNGMKHFISNGGIAKLYVLVTRTDPKVAALKGMTYFMVAPGTKGFTIGEVHDKMGQRLSQNAELIFENCRVPDRDRITEVGGGARARAGSFSRGSVIESAATALGPARAAYEDAVEYAKNRVQGGKPIIQHQAIGFALADCYIEYVSARQTLHYAAWMAMKDEGYDPKLGYMAKAYASEACFRIAKRALEVWGGMGYMTEAPMEKYLRDVTSFLHSAGTNEAQHVRSMPYL